MTRANLTGTTAMVTGASRGFGRAIAVALHDAGADVVAVARSPERLRTLRDELDDTSLVTIAADATDPVLAGALIDEYRPTMLVLNAGAGPLNRPIHHHTWETFSRNWDVDVRHVFHWVREALLSPLVAGSTVITMSSGASLRGSPLSGGYAGAKAAIRFITGYAADESVRAGLGIRFLSVLPKLTPATGMGALGVAAYAQRAGSTIEELLAELGPTLGPEQVAEQVLDLAATAERGPGAYLLTPAGPSLVP